MVRTKQSIEERKASRRASSKKYNDRKRREDLLRLASYSSAPPQPLEIPSLVPSLPATDQARLPAREDAETVDTVENSGSPSANTGHPMIKSRASSPQPPLSPALILTIRTHSRSVTVTRSWTKSVSEEVTPNLNSPPKKRGRGRPRKPILPLITCQSNPLHKRERGRPRKHPVLPPITCESSNTQTTLPAKVGSQSRSRGVLFIL